MEKKEKKSFNRIMRSLHRDAGYLIFGFVIIYALSGIVLIYRDTDFMKKDVIRERTLAPNLGPEELGREMRMPGFIVDRTEGDILYFGNGSYNTATGVTQFTAKDLRFPLNKFSELHKIISGSGKHWFMVVFGILLLFMALSSLWMFKPGTKFFSRGMIYVGAGLVIAIILLFIK